MCWRVLQGWVEAIRSFGFVWTGPSMAHDLMQRWSQDYNVQLNPKGVVVQWMPLARALVRSRWPLCMHELSRHTHWPPRIWDAGQEGPQVHWGLPRLPEPAPHVRAICHDGLHLHWEWRRPPDPAPYVGATGHDGPHGQVGLRCAGRRATDQAELSAPSANPRSLEPAG